MTQVWPGFGLAPVPTLLSDICKPEAVVMGFPAVWAVAVWVGASATTPTNNAINENAARVLAGRKLGILPPQDKESLARVFSGSASRYKGYPPNGTRLLCAGLAEHE